MDLIHSLFNEKILTAVGWTLAHSLWQIALIACMLWLTLRVFPVLSSQLRYMAGLTALVLIVLVTVWTFSDQLNKVPTSYTGRVWTSPPSSEIPIELHAVKVMSADTALLPLASVYWEKKVENLIPYLVNLWMLGVLFYGVRLLGSLYDLQKLHRKHNDSISTQLLKKVDSISAALGIYQKVQELKSTLVNSPITYGTIKPVILLPAGLVFSLSPAQLEAIVAHELAHIKRNDYLINLFQSFLEVFFFFHPGFWWINRLINDERENATDDLALSVGINAQDLAYGLAEAANYSNSWALDMALAASEHKHKTLQRIKRILGKSNARPELSPLIPITMILAFITASALMVGAQVHDFAKSEPRLLTAISQELTVPKEILPMVKVVARREYVQDTIPAKTAPKAKEGMPTLDVLAPPRLEVDMPAISDLPPAPPVPFADFDFPKLDIHTHADSLASLALKIRALDGDDSPEAKKQRKVLEAAMERVQLNLSSITEAMEEKMAAWQAKHGESFKAYEKEMKVWEEKMKEHQKEWESSFAPKMQEFGNKMKQWEEENAPKFKEFEEKMKRWAEENEANFQWKESNTTASF